MKRGGARVLEFFAGAGLVRLALEPEWRCVFANDSSEKKASVYRANFGDRELHVGDVADLQAVDLPDAEMAWASFPCQDLSLAGWRGGMSAPRSGTFWSFWRLMREMGERRPRLIVLENVVGLLYGDGFRGLCEALASLDLRFGAMVVDARWFLPQSRPRVFLVASNSPPDDLTGFVDWSAPPGLVRAYENLPPDLRERWVWWSLPRPAAPAPMIESLIEDDAPDARWLAAEEVDRLCSMMTPRNRRKLDHAGRSIGFLYRRTRDGRQRAEVRFDGMAGCLRTPEGGSSRQTVVFVDGDRIRMRLLTAREAARLMGAPEDFRLPESYNDAYRAMGDGVAVPVIRWMSLKLLIPLTRDGSSSRLAQSS